MFISNEPALILDDALAIADLHIGITKDIWDKGIRIPSQIASLVGRINALQKKTSATRLLLLGDVKHHIPTISWQEEREIPAFFNQLNFDRIIILKGNHDGNIERLVPGHVKVRASYSYRTHIFTHGHRHITTSKKIIVIGHNQPHIQFRDEMKATYIEPIWVKGPLTGPYANKRVIMMPAFNELAGATLVNRDELLGPIARCIDPARAHCYLLDGTDLGHITDLAIKDPPPWRSKPRKFTR